MNRTAGRINKTWTRCKSRVIKIGFMITFCVSLYIYAHTHIRFSSSNWFEWREIDCVCSSLASTLCSICQQTKIHCMHLMCVLINRHNLSEEKNQNERKIIQPDKKRIACSAIPLVRSACFAALTQLMCSFKFVCTIDVTTAYQPRCCSSLFSIK